MKPSNTLNKLNSPEDKLSATSQLVKSKPMAEEKNQFLSSFKYIGPTFKNSDDDVANSDEENLRKKSSNPDSTVSFPLEEVKSNIQVLKNRVIAANYKKSGLNPSGNSTHDLNIKPSSSSDSGAVLSSITSSSNANNLVLNQQRGLNNQIVPTTSNRNYTFLAGPTQLDNITRQDSTIITSPENEKLRKMRIKKENKDKKKDKNVKIYTTGVESKGEGAEPEFSIDKVLESLGEVQNNKQGRKISKTKPGNIKEINGSGLEKSKNQTIEMFSQPDTIKKSCSNASFGNDQINENETDIPSGQSTAGNQCQNNKEMHNEKKSSLHYDNLKPTKVSITNTPNNVLSDPDSNSTVNIIKENNKSAENSFTTVVTKKQKNKKKISGRDQDTNSAFGSSMSSFKRSYLPNHLQHGTKQRVVASGTGQPNGMSNNRDRGSVGNTGAKTSATNTSGSLSETNQSHPEVLRSSSSSAALVNANNTENSNKYNHYQMQHNNQKSTGTSSITSDSITGESLSESASLATDLDLAADFPPLGLNEISAPNLSGNSQNVGSVDDQTTIGNRAPIPKAVWPIVRPNISSSDSTAVIENNVITTNVNENVNHASEPHNSNNAVASPDVSISSISTSSFTTASSNITSNVPSSQRNASNIPTDLSTNTVSVAQSNYAPSYSSALLGCNSNNKAITDVTAIKSTHRSAKLPGASLNQNGMLMKPSPPDITAQTTNIRKDKAPLPDVTAQASKAAAGYENNDHLASDSGCDTPKPIIATDVCKDDSGYHDILPISNDYDDQIAGSAGREMDTYNQNDSISSATLTQSESQNSCYYVDDKRAVAIVLSEKAYNYSDNGRNQVMNMNTSDMDNDSTSNAPAVTILGRGETPVADWSSRCDGLEFGGPINEDLLSMDYMKPYDMEHNAYNTYMEPRDTYYQEVIIAKANNGNMVTEPSYENEVSGQVIFEAHQSVDSRNEPQQHNLPLPDMDRAIISFGECPDQNINTVPNVNASYQITPHVFDSDNNELTTGQDTNDVRISDSYERYPNSSGMTSGLKYDSNMGYVGEGLTQETSGNMVNTQSIASASTNSSEENYPQSVPLNDELNDFSATNWASQLENGVSADDEKQPESFLEANFIYNTPAINEANKVNYNYQEILSFVSTSWEKVEKELMSGAKGKYYYSKSVPSKSTSNIAKLNNVQKH